MFRFRSRFRLRFSNSETGFRVKTRDSDYYDSTFRFQKGQSNQNHYEFFLSDVTHFYQAIVKASFPACEKHAPAFRFWSSEV